MSVDTLPTESQETFTYQTQFVLNRQHYEECFDESVTPVSGWRPYLKAILFALSGLVLLYSPVEAILGFLFIGLGAVEALSVKYKRTWWLWRQLVSKAANHEVNLTMDEQGIHLQSDYVKQSFLWENLEAITATTQGYLLQQGKYRGYISQRILNEAATAYLEQRAQALS